MSVRLAYVNILSSDPEGLAAFYREALGFAEIEGHRSPIYRCLDAGGVELGFNADLAYDLLGIAERRPNDVSAVRVFATFEMASAEAVDQGVRRCEALGGRIVKAPYGTYYNAWQAVLEDPEGNVFRLNCRLGPRAPADEAPNPPWRHPA